MGEKKEKRETEEKRRKIKGEEGRKREKKRKVERAAHRENASPEERLGSVGESSEWKDDSWTASGWQ